VLYVLFIFLSSLLILVDYFSNKEISSYIPKSLTFEFNLNVFESTYIDSFNSLLTSRAELVSENIRLEQEVKSLRALEIENSSLKEKIESFENISLIKNFNNSNFIETSLIIKNSSNEFLISGGTNQNFQNGDLVLDDTGYVQPTKDQLRSVRGENSIYHNNGIQTWALDSNGIAENVEVS